MRYSHILLFLCFIVILSDLSASERVKVTLNLKNLPSGLATVLHISMDSVVYYETGAALPSDSISLELKEPVPAMIIANNILPSNRLFWIHEGEFEVAYDLKDYSLTFLNSPLNNSYQRITAIRDSINYIKKKYTTDLHKYMDEGLRQKDSLAKQKLDETYFYFKTHESEIDSLDSIADRIIYQYHFKNPKSFLALDFVKSKLLYGSFDKHKLRVLFALLPENLKKYPSYSICKELLEQYFPKSQPNGRSPLSVPK